jgi:hypothetical protein
LSCRSWQRSGVQCLLARGAAEGHSLPQHGPCRAAEPGFRPPHHTRKQDSGGIRRRGQTRSGVPVPQPRDVARHRVDLQIDRIAIGGEGSLANFASILDRDGDGNPVDDIMDMAKGLFGKS